MVKNKKTNIDISEKNYIQKRSKINKTFLGIFLMFIILAFSLKIIISILYDMGLSHGHLHFGFWKNPEKSFGSEWKSWASKHNNKIGNVGFTFNDFLNDKENSLIKEIIVRHPSTFWILTQFTWITTIIIMFFLIFRFFKFEDKLPKWLRWIMSQRTLSLLAMYDVVVGVVYWIGLAQSFSSSFGESLYLVNFLNTIMVHAMIPVIFLSYSVIFLMQDKKASMLKEFFALRGLIYPAIYICYYMVLTIIWTDPYPISSMHETLLNDHNGNSLIGSNHPNWSAWSKELWKGPAALIGIYVLLGMMTVVHNIILLKFNKSYDKDNDFDAIRVKHLKLEKIKNKIIENKEKELKSMTRTIYIKSLKKKMMLKKNKRKK